MDTDSNPLSLDTNSVQLDYITLEHERVAVNTSALDGSFLSYTDGGKSSRTPMHKNKTKNSKIDTHTKNVGLTTKRH